MRMFVFIAVCLLYCSQMQVVAQVADSTVNLDPVIVPVADSLSSIKPVVDTAVAKPAPIISAAESMPKDTVQVKKKRTCNFSINKRDTVFYSKMLNFGVGPTLLYLEDPMPDYWKNRIGFSIGYSDAINKWLRFNINLDYTNYQFNKSKYLDDYTAGLKKSFDADTIYFTNSKRNTNPDGVANEISSTLDSSRNYADKYISFRNNNLGVVQLGLGFQIRPINNYFIQPYGLLGFNINITTNSIALLKSDFGLKETTIIVSEYQEGPGEFVDVKKTVYVPTVTYTRTAYINNSIDGSLGLMFGFGCDVFLSKRFGLYGEFRRNVSQKSWQDDYGSFQYGINTIRFGIKYRIK